MPILYLDDFVASGNELLVRRSLETTSYIDILRDEGILIKLAILSKNANVVKLLFKYFEDNQLSEFQEPCLERAKLLEDMGNVIWRTLYSREISAEMRATLSKYYDFNESREDSVLGDDYSAEMPVHTSTAAYPVLTSEALAQRHIDSEASETDARANAISSWVTEHSDLTEAASATPLIGEVT